jgi:hypothetical protein
MLAALSDAATALLPPAPSLALPGSSGAGGATGAPPTGLSSEGLADDGGLLALGPVPPPPGYGSLPDPLAAEVSPVYEARGVRVAGQAMEGVRDMGPGSCMPCQDSRRGGHISE